jgi:hypothetical protein
MDLFLLIFVIARNANSSDYGRYCNGASGAIS